MIKPAVIDLSHHNVIPQSLELARASGILGCIHKCTEGTSYVDSKVDARRFLAGEAGMLWGLYHFVRPGDMKAQAHHFVTAAEPVSDHETLYALDWEVPGLTVDDACAFLEEVESLTGHHPVIYSGHVLKETLNGKPSARLSEYRLWIAHYTSGNPTLPPGWDKYFLHQYTDTGKVEGVTPPTDLNAFDGTAAELMRNWARSPAPLVA